MCSFFLIIQQQVTDYSIILCPIVLRSAGCFICVLSTFFFCFFFTFHLLAILNKANINSNKLY